MSSFGKPDRGAGGGGERALTRAEVTVPPGHAHILQGFDPVSFGGLVDDEHREGVEPCPIIEAEFRAPPRYVAGTPLKGYLAVKIAAAWHG
jgi:hypothetical protein